MTRRALVPSMILVSMAVACSPRGSSGTGGEGTGGVGGDDHPTVDAGAMGNDTVAREGMSVTQITSAKAVMNAFIEDDPTLDLAKDAAGNAANIAARVAAETKGCAGVSVSHADQSVTVEVDFGTGCTLGSTSITVGGQASATASAGGGTVSVAFTFTDIAVEGFVLNGTAAVATSDLKTYSLDADLREASAGHVKFFGTAAVGMTNSQLGVTLEGTGSYEGTGGIAEAPSGSGWACGSIGTTFTMTGLHRSFAACYADAGEVVVTRGYACEKTIKTKTITAEASVTTTIDWSQATAMSGEVQVSVTTEIDGQSLGGDSFSATLPGHGQCGG